MNELEEEWLWGWDTTSGIVSVWAEPDGRVFVWRRLPETRALIREDARFRSWMLLSSLQDLTHLGGRLRRENERPSGSYDAGALTYEELEGPGELRYLVRADDGRTLTQALLRGAARRLRRPIARVRDLDPREVLALPPEEQYLVASGRNYFRGLGFDELRRLQLDLETTGLDPEHDRIFLLALRDPDGRTEVLEAARAEDEPALLQDVFERIAALDPDVIENHNLHGFDLPFLARRAELHRVPIQLGRLGRFGLWRRPSARGTAIGRDLPEIRRRTRFTVPGRELIDTLDAVLRHDFSARDLPGHGLKAVARHFKLSAPDREYVPGRRVYAVFVQDPERVRRYAQDDVTEAAGVARLLGGAAFALARMAPRRYERLADAGAATGVLDPLLVRAYLRAKAALPTHETGDGTPHSGAALHLFAAGRSERIVKADVASLYPSLMRQYHIGPQRDRLGALLAIVDRLVDQRLAAKARARAAPPGSEERYTDEALAAAMKIVVNSAYGYLGAVGLTRFSDVHAANEVTRRGRAVLGLLCRELAARGVTLLEADTDGVYFAVPPSWAESDERRVVAEVAALLPARVRLEFDGRYAAMLSHEPKNYALKPYSGPLVLRGVAFRSSRAEPFGEHFLRRAIERLLVNDLVGIQAIYVETAAALRARTIPTRDVSSRVRLTKTPELYASGRDKRRELGYEALLAAGRTHWTVGEHIRVYRAAGGRAGLLHDDEEDEDPARHTPGGAAADPRDYDADYYVRLLHKTFAARLARALTPQDFAAVFSDPEQPSLFPEPLAERRPILTQLLDARELAADDASALSQPVSVINP